MKVVLSVLIALLIAPGAASAASIALSTSGNLAEEQTWQLRATGTSDAEEARVLITIKPAGGPGCAANWEADTGDTAEPNGAFVEGAYDEVGNVTQNEPGEFVLCGWLQRQPNDTTPLAKTGPIAITVRSNAASVAIAPPPQVRAGEPLPVSVSGSTELERYVYLGLQPSTVACPANWAATTNTLRSTAWELNGNFAQTFQTTAPAAGSYVVCAYVQEGSADLAPEAVASANLSVLETQACATARAALAQAVASRTRASKRVAAARKAYKQARSRRAKARARRTLASRKRAHTRAKSRVAAAQAVVADEC